MSLAPAVARYLIEISIQNRSLAYIRVTPEGQLLDWGGALSRYRLESLKPGDFLEEHLFFLAGFFPMAVGTDVLPSIHIEPGCIADVHLICDPDDSWVLLLDVTAATEQQQQLQQKGNDLSLLRHHYVKLLDQCLTSSQPTIVESVKSATSDRQKDISILSVRVCNLTQFSQQTTPAAALKALNAYISPIANIILEEGGIVNHILGETAVALFGLLPSHLPPPQQAVRAARRIAQQFQAVSGAPPTVSFGVGSGITTGRATAGLVRDRQGQQSLNAIGDHVYHATQLNGLLRPGSLLVDGPTVRALDKSGDVFEPVAPSARGGLPELYRWVVPE